MLAIPIPPQSSELEIIWRQLEEFWMELVRATPRLSVALAALLLTWLLASIGTRVLRHMLAKTKMRASLQALLRQLAFAGLWIAGLLVVANIAFPTLTPGKTLTALGIGSIAIGFAFKDIFENFFAGVLILWRFPFENGDFIRCGDLVGRVEETTIRMTLVRQTDGRLVVIPNARLFKEPVEVQTGEELARLAITVGIAYGADIEHARTVIHKAVTEQPTIATKRPVDVQVNDFKSSSIEMRILCWTGSDPAARREATDQVLTAIKHALDAAHIEIPFPHRTLTMGVGMPEQLGKAFASANT